MSSKPMFRTYAVAVTAGLVLGGIAASQLASGQDQNLEEIVARVLARTETLKSLRSATFVNPTEQQVADIGHFGLEGRITLGATKQGERIDHEVELGYGGLEVNWRGKQVAFLGKDRGPTGGTGQLSLSTRGGQPTIQLADGVAHFFTKARKEVVYVGSAEQNGREIGVVRVNGRSVGDYAEVFDLATRRGVIPGTVMSFVEEGGRIAPSTIPYDPKVAGTVSGAGGLSSGMQIGAREESNDSVPIAMSGQVYVRVCEEGGPLEVGDLLVSSSRAGVAMRATDHRRMLGAVIGKAIEPFHGTPTQPEGLVRILVMSR